MLPDKNVTTAVWINAEADDSVVQLCLDTKTLEDCHSRQVNAYLLEEAHPAHLNYWAFDQCLRFIARLPRNSEEELYAQANFMAFEAFFAQVLKFSLGLEQLLVNYPNLKTIHAYDRAGIYCASVWKSWIETRNVPIHFDSVFRNTQSFSLLKTGKATLRCLATEICNLLSKVKWRRLQKSGHSFYLASGGLNHLSGLLDALTAESRAQIVFIEKEFNLEKFRYCREKGYVFFVKKSQPPLSAERFKAFLTDIHYKERDYSMIFQKTLQVFMNQEHFLHFTDKEFVKKFVDDKLCSGVLLDEDMSNRRLLYVAAEKAGKQSFVVSHGFPGMILDGDLRKGNYPAAVTFVQSPIEKEAYEMIGYRSADLRVTGIPRYDRIASLAKKAPSSGNSKKIILYCAASLMEYDFLSLSPYLGIPNFYGETTRRFMQDLLKVLRGERDVLLWVKPHYDEEDLWRSFMTQLSPIQVPLVVFSHREDIFRLEKEAHVVVTPESSVICESWMFEKPVILYNYTSYPLMYPFDIEGPLYSVHHSEELAGALKTCLRDESAGRRYEEELRQKSRRLLGACDGQGTQRVVAEILKGSQCAGRETLYARSVL